MKANHSLHRTAAGCIGFVAGEPLRRPIHPTLAMTSARGTLRT